MFINHKLIILKHLIYFIFFFILNFEQNCLIISLNLKNKILNISSLVFKKKNLYNSYIYMDINHYIIYKYKIFFR
jgi:hypothetical protein